MADHTVPSPSAPFGGLVRFGTHLYGDYESFGGFSRLMDRVQPVHDAWAADGSLPSDARVLTEAIFAEARRLHHLAEGAGEEDTYLRALVAQLGMVSGGRVTMNDSSLRLRIRRVAHRVRRRFTFEA